MCTNSVKSYTNARYIGKHYVTSFKNWFPCCFCSECIGRKQSEWRLRAYYQALDYFRYDDSFVLFDTLTYRDENLKYFHDIFPASKYQYWDFMSFSREDVKDFLRDLRKRLEQLGFDVRENLIVLVTSEYGSRPDCTHRPHYHILFFVKFKIDPILLSYIIGDVWKHGRTDGVKYKGENYVRYQRVFRNSDASLLKICNYVTKYITKDFYTYKKLFGRCFKSFSVMHPGWTESYKMRCEFRRFKNQVLPFHLQGLGFGKHGIEIYDIDKIIESNSLPMPISSKGIVAHIPLPQYYQRKLFYEHYKFEGRVCWKLNDKGVERRLKNLNKSIQSFSSRLKSFRYDCDADRIARFHLIWNGKLMPKQFLCLSDEDFFRESLSTDRYRIKANRLNGEVFYNMSHPSESYHHGKYIYDVLDNDLIRSWSLQEFAKFPPDDLILIDGENCPERFKGCQEFLDEFFDWLRLNGESMDRLNERNEEIRDQLKTAGLVEF